MGARRSAILILVAGGALNAVIFAAGFLDTFSTMPTNTCFTDGDTIGEWSFVYDGYGCNEFISMNGDTMLSETPLQSTAPAETHGALVAGPAITGDLTFQVSTMTARQLRVGSAPNPWEVSWVVWHYTDDWHFYYFIAKPNGWELGKGDPTYIGGQRFIAASSSPSFPIGQWYRVRISQTGNVIQVYVNDLLVATVTDAERPYYSGRIALYTEDAATYFDNVSLTSGGAATKGKGRRR